ncbi:MAG TPA: hypothetical protein VMN36_02895 [Verrucomicrobiales bacterium]|nr:hypothetical protein [Verrucomicrobiales bacterium]
MKNLTANNALQGPLRVPAAPERTRSLQQMHWSECQLSLKSIREDGRIKLNFTQPVLGFPGHLCTIEKKIGETILEGEFTDIPDCFTRLIFRLTHGLRDYQPLKCVRSSSEPRDAVRFYECLDRRGQRRKFVYATEPKQDGGGSFLVRTEDFDRVWSELSTLDKESESEQRRSTEPLTRREFHPS